MKSTLQGPVILSPQPVRNVPPPCDWFLRDSHWSDVIWIFAPTSRLDAEHPVRIRWDFTLSSGRRFTDAQYATLLQSTKEHLALVRSYALSSGLTQRASTVGSSFFLLRLLIRWMDQEKFARFADLDSAALLQFRHSIARRTGRKGPGLASTTMALYLRLLRYLYRNRHEVSDALQIDPCPGQSYLAAAGVRDSELRRGPPTPDIVAIPLVQGAIEFLSSSALDILRARELYAQAIAQARGRGPLRPACKSAATATLRALRISTPRGPCVIDSTSVFAELVDMLYAACFVVIAYLLGARASEILCLQAGCVQPLADKEGAHTTDLAVIVGAIFKHEAGYHGRPHEWVAPPPAVHAIAVLEALSAPHRLPSGRTELWLRPKHRVLTAQWQQDHPQSLWIAPLSQLGTLLERFGAWLALPDYEGQPWHLSTHQGRRTFARFVALRDRTGLFALAQHLGHRDRAITDQGYAGTDYRLDREIDAEVLEQSVSAWEHMLSAPDLGGRGGREIIAKRPRFRGARMKQDIKSYARMLVETGLTLGVCDWGFCVYRQEHSACLGNASGPNPVRREPSTCARCKNFVVSKEHRAYWLDQAHRHEALLNEPALPTQTLKIARARLEEARAVIRSIDSSTQEEAP